MGPALKKDFILNTGISLDTFPTRTRLCQQNHKIRKNDKIHKNETKNEMEQREQKKQRRNPRIAGFLAAEKVRHLLAPVRSFSVVLIPSASSRYSITCGADDGPYERKKSLSRFQNTTTQKRSIEKRWKNVSKPKRVAKTYARMPDPPFIKPTDSSVHPTLFKDVHQGQAFAHVDKFNVHVDTTLENYTAGPRPRIDENKEMGHDSEISEKPEIVDSPRAHGNTQEAIPQCDDVLHLKKTNEKNAGQPTPLDPCTKLLEEKTDAEREKKWNKEENKKNMKNEKKETEDKDKKHEKRVWKTVTWHKKSTRYEVSNMGEVRNKKMANFLLRRSAESSESAGSAESAGSVESVESVEPEETNEMAEMLESTNEVICDRSVSKDFVASSNDKKNVSRKRSEESTDTRRFLAAGPDTATTKRTENVVMGLLTPSYTGDHYATVGLCVGGRTRTVYLHRLVATAHVPNPDNKPEVNHKNGRRSDNRACNLEWVEVVEQQRRKHNRATKTCGRPVVQLTLFKPSVPDFSPLSPLSPLSPFSPFLPFLPVSKNSLSGHQNPIGSLKEKETFLGDSLMDTSADPQMDPMIEEVGGELVKVWFSAAEAVRCQPLTTDRSAFDTKNEGCSTEPLDKNETNDETGKKKRKLDSFSSDEHRSVDPAFQKKHKNEKTEKAEKVEKKEKKEKKEKNEKRWTSSGISRACRTKTKHAGYCWMFLDEWEPQDPEEEWRQVTFCGETYMASSSGRVRTAGTGKPTFGFSDRWSFFAKKQNKIIIPPKEKDGKNETEIKDKKEETDGKNQKEEKEEKEGKKEGEGKNDNYLRIGLKGGGTVRVHKLIALAFHGPRPPGAVINHLSGDVTDNRPQNLEYCTPAANSQHAHDHGLNPVSQPVLCISADHKNKVEFPSIADAARTINSTVAKVTQACDRSEGECSIMSDGSFWQRLPRKIVKRLPDPQHLVESF